MFGLFSVFAIADTLVISAEVSLRTCAEHLCGIVQGMTEISPLSAVHEGSR